MRIYNVVIVLGSDREAGSLAPLILAMRNQPDLRPAVVIAGAARDSCCAVLRLFDITPDFTVNIGQEYRQPSGYDKTCRSDLDDLLYEQPDLVLTQANTDISLVTALAAFFHRVPVMQVGDALPSPGITGADTDHHPGELDERLAMGLCAMHLVSTRQGAQRLLENGVPPDAIVCIDDPALDSRLTTLAALITQRVRLLGDRGRPDDTVGGGNAVQNEEFIPDGLLVLPDDTGELIPAANGLAAQRAVQAIRRYLRVGPRPDRFQARTGPAAPAAAGLDELPRPHYV